MLQISRANAPDLVTTEEIMEFYFRAQSSAASESPVDKAALESIKDCFPCDGFLTLATSYMSDKLSCETPRERMVNSLFLAYWLAHLGLNFSPSNHHLQLSLMKLYSPYGGLNLTPQLLSLFAKAEIKQSLLNSLG
ncbi:hypothetical protein Ciccas_003874 [Cichlidogyrus casuarinus]|uniref:Uncharacterized protein n=1 Tax=Cichlidogyrus casuarinus TaxID=1844966 RepID=A0ABD2QD36_9PLAT